MIENIKLIAYRNKIQKKVRCESIRNVHALLKYCLFYLRIWLLIGWSLQSRHVIKSHKSPFLGNVPMMEFWKAYTSLVVLSQIHYEIYIFSYIQISCTSFDKANVHPANTSKECVNMFVLVPMSFLSLVYVLIISWGPMKSVLRYFWAKSPDSIY